MEQRNDRYPGFAYTAAQLSAYIYVLNTFIISLKNGQLIRYRPDDIQSFTHWLSANRLRHVLKNQSFSPYAMAG